MKIEIYPPCINASEYHFKAQTTPAIRYGLGAIKGVGEAAIEVICQARVTDGPFSSLFDFCQRLDLRKVNRRVIEALIKAGAMDTFKVGRAQLMLTIEKALKLADKAQANMAIGQQDLFSEEINEEVYLPAKDWNLKQSLEGERETLGLYFSGHPVDQYQQEMQALVKTRIGSLHPSSHKTALIMGLVTGVRRLLTKKEKKMAVVSLDDNTGRVDVAVFQETLEECDELLEKDKVIAIEGEISHDEFSGGIKMAAKKVMDMQSIRKIYGKRLNIRLNHHDQPKLEQLEQSFKAYPGEIPVLIQYTNQELTVPIRLSSNFDVSADDACLQDFRDLLGVEAVKFI
jgi:DNA polymerase-3 subunit alpha